LRIVEVSEKINQDCPEEEDLSLRFKKNEDLFS